MSQPASASYRENPELPDNALARMLHQHGCADDAQLQEALKIQHETGAFLGEILVEAGVLNEESLLGFLARNCKIPHLSLLDYLIEAEHIALLPWEFCLKHRLLPIDLLGQNLTIAMVNPLDREALRAVRAACPELHVKPVLCAYRHFEKVAEKFFHDKTSNVQSTVSLDTFGLSDTRPAAAPQALQENGAAEKSAQSTSTASPEARESLLQAIFKQDEAEAMNDFGERIGQVRQDSRDSNIDEMLEQTTVAMLDSMRATYQLLARRIALFRDMDAEDVARIFAKGLSLEVEADALIFNKGDEADGLYIILDGTVTIFDGRHVLAELGRGDTVGEMALINGGQRSASARAITRSSLLKITMPTLLQHLSPEAANRLLMNLVVILSERLRSANTQLLMMLRNMVGSRA